MTITISLDPVILQIGLVQVRWYGLTLALGFLVGFLLAGRLVDRARLREDDLFSLMLWVLVAAVVGARTSFIIQNDLGSFLRQPSTIMTTWQSGLDFYGGLAGGLLAVLVYSRLRRINPVAFAQPALLAVLAGHMLTRAGCLVNGCASGVPVASGLRLTYSNANSLATRVNVPLAPTQLWELLWDGMLLVAVVLIGRRLRREINPLLLLSVYSLGRAVVFVWRDEPTIAGALKAGQLVALGCVILAGAASLLLRSRANARVRALEGSG